MDQCVDSFAYDATRNINSYRNVFFYAKIGLLHSVLGLVLAHSRLGIPFVMISVASGMTNVDVTLELAALIHGKPQEFRHFFM